MCENLPFVKFKNPTVSENGSAENVSGVFVVMHTGSSVVVAPSAYKKIFLQQCNGNFIYVQDGYSASSRGVQLGNTFEVTVNAVIAALIDAEVPPSEISVLKVGFCGYLPVKKLRRRDPVGDVLARLGVALDVDQVQRHSVIAALNNILVQKDHCCIVDLDVK